MRPIGSYFGWSRGSDSKTSTPTDTPSRRVSTQILWESSPTEGRLSPFRGLDGMQECFWIEGNLRHTGRQLDTCSERLNRMSDSAIHIRKELEDLQKILASMRTRGGGATRRDAPETEPRNLEEQPKQSSPVPTPEKIESPSPQAIQFQDISPQSPSYTTASVQTIEEREVITGGMESPTHHVPEYLNVFPEILDSIEEESLPQNDALDEAEDLPKSSPLAEEGGSKEEQDEEDSQWTPRSVESSAALQEADDPQDVAETKLKKEEEQLKTHRPVQPSPPEQNRPSQTAAGSTMVDEEEHQRIPRSLRPNPVQKRFPFSAAGHSAAGGSRSTHTKLSNRASLKPVIGQKKVSQMTQFWSQKMGTAPDV